ncbi:DUF1269 domain-containing protein [Microterricola viridarii]|uniref:DUF1269 domain-containing protein n=1 Tax=Microterricola viridarii TaxID=412690 RepID=A0A0X8E577_9MICO|nr:DUF1269 domain-containing protein [Microterricola viridarii]AMB59271.1 hypothetical protein AWU67_10815 [Microterricola viridarii]
MADQAYVAIAAQYATEEEAVADFEQIHEHYKAADKHTSFDAAVIKRDMEGKLSIPKRDDGGKHHGVRKGLGIGLAGGLAVALFPAVALGGALLVAGGSGAGIGAIAGHIARKTPSKDLELISETLDAGSAGIVLVVEPGESDEVQKLLAHATRVTVTELAVDDEELDEEVVRAYE